MAGLERPDSGSIDDRRRRLDALGEDALARFRGARIGIVFQSFHLIPTMTALENVAAPLELAGAPRRLRARGAELATVGLADARQPLSRPAFGRRAAARRAGAGSRAASLDPDRRRADRQSRRRERPAIIDLLFALQRARGATLVLVTHDPALAARCDRTLRMRSGALESPALVERAAISAAKMVGGASSSPRLGWRDLRGGLAGLRLSSFCIALGVGGVVSVVRWRARLKTEWRTTAGLSRRRRLVFADAARTRPRGARLPRRVAANSRRSRRCARWRAMARATQRSSRSRRSTPPGRALGRGGFRTGNGDGGGAGAPMATYMGAAVEEALLDRLEPQGRQFLRSWRGAPRGSAPSSSRSPTGWRREIGLGPARAHLARGARGLPTSSNRARSSAGRRACFLAPAARRRARRRSRRSSIQAKAAFPRSRLGRRERDRRSRRISLATSTASANLALVGLISLVVGGVGVANAAQTLSSASARRWRSSRRWGRAAARSSRWLLIEFLAAALIGVGAGAAMGRRRPSPSRRYSAPSCRCRWRRRSTPANWRSGR